MAIRITMINSAARADTAGDGLLMSPRRMYQRRCCRWFNDRLTRRLRRRPSGMLSGAVNLFTAEFDFSLFNVTIIIWMHLELKKSPNKSQGTEEDKTTQRSFFFMADLKAQQACKWCRQSHYMQNSLYQCFPSICASSLSMKSWESKKVRLSLFCLLYFSESVS